MSTHTLLSHHLFVEAVARPTAEVVDAGAESRTGSSVMPSGPGETEDESRGQSQPLLTRTVTRVPAGCAGWYG
jgi:hypothetical protein